MYGGIRRRRYFMGPLMRSQFITIAAPSALVGATHSSIFNLIYSLYGVPAPENRDEPRSRGLFLRLHLWNTSRQTSLLSHDPYQYDWKG